MKEKTLIKNARISEAVIAFRVTRKAIDETYAVLFRKEATCLKLEHNLSEAMWEHEAFEVYANLQGNVDTDAGDELIEAVSELEIKLEIKLAEGKEARLNHAVATWEFHKSWNNVLRIEVEEGIETDSYRID